MQVQTMITRYQTLGLQDIRTQFVDVCGLAGIVTCALYATAQGSCLNFKACHVIGLPAME